MASQTSTIPAVLDAIKALLEERKAVDGNLLARDVDVGRTEEVVITTAASGDPAPLESVQMLEIPNDTHTWKSLGGQQREERYTILGEILIVRPEPGEESAKAARDRAYDIAGEVQTVLWANAKLPIATRTSIQYATGGLDQGWQPNGRVAVVPFAIDVLSVLSK